MTKVLAYLIWCLPAVAVGIGIEAAFIITYPQLFDAHSLLWLAVMFSLYLFGRSLIARSTRRQEQTID